MTSKSTMTRTYGYKLLERGTLKVVESGQTAAWSKLQLKDSLAKAHPRIPRKNIIVWDLAKDDEPLTTSTPRYSGFAFYVRQDADRYRVWPIGRGWFGDTFEVLQQEEFSSLDKMMKRFGIEVIILTDNEEPVDA